MALDPALILQGQTPNMAEAFQKGAMNQAALNTSQAQLPGIQADSTLKQASLPYALQGAQLDNMVKKNTVGMQLLSSAVDEDSYQRSLKAAKNYGLDTTQMPDHYDSRVIQQMQMGALQVKDRLDMMYKNADLGIKQQELGIKQGTANRENNQAMGKNPSLPISGGTLGAPNAMPQSLPSTQPADQGSIQIPQKGAPLPIDGPQDSVAISPIPNAPIQSPQPSAQGQAQLLQQPEAQQYASNVPQNTGLQNKGILPDAVYNQAAETDAKREQAATNNNMVADNALEMLDALEPNIDNFNTGSFGEERAKATKLASTLGIPGTKDSATAAGNIDKNTMGLITELNKFEYMPGMRGSDLALGIIKASKPGNDQLPEVNKNIISELRGKLWSYKLGDQITKQYKENSPLKVTDAQSEQVTQSLLKLYPLTKVDSKTGKITFNADNIGKIQAATPDAVQNPQKYIQAAQIKSGVPTFSSQNDPGFKNLPSGTQFKTSDGQIRIKH